MESKRNYLISGDLSKIVIVWDLKSYKPLHIIDTCYSQLIQAFLLLFEKNICEAQFIPLLYRYEIFVEG